MKDFGAVGDGVTDDQTAIQNAINFAAATPGSTVFFPPGNYRHNAPLFANGVHLTGKGATLTHGTSGAFLSFGGTGSSISDLIIDATATATSGVQFLSAQQFSMRNVVLLASKFFTPLVVAGSSDGVVESNQIGPPTGLSPLLSLSGSHRVVITKNTFNGSGVALPGILVLVPDSNDLQVVGNLFTDLRYALLASSGTGSNWVFSKNTIARAILDGVFVGTAVNGFTIEKNKIEQCGGRGILAAGCSNLVLNKNSVSQCGLEGIQVTNTLPVPGFLKINKNHLADCALRTAPNRAVIFVGTPNYTSVEITGNSYKGNTANLNFFIRCVIPIPPTVAFGNKTKTLLPNQFGP